MEREKSYTIGVKIHTGSSKRDIIHKDGIFHIYTHFKPVQGKANLDALKIISNYFDIPKSNILIIKGEKSKDKVFRIKGNLKIKDGVK